MERTTFVSNPLHTIQEEPPEDVETKTAGCLCGFTFIAIFMGIFCR
jgi:hypothetical protein